MHYLTNNTKNMYISYWYQNKPLDLQGFRGVSLGFPAMHQMLFPSRDPQRDYQALVKSRVQKQEELYSVRLGSPPLLATAQ